MWWIPSVIGATTVGHPASSPHRWPFPICARVVRRLTGPGRCPAPARPPRPARAPRGSALPLPFPHGPDCAAVPPAAPSSGAGVIRTRGAAAGDAPAVTGVVAAAFTRYVERLGGIRPWPMTLDYAEIIADGQTWVAEEVAGDVAGHLAAGDVVGVLV